VCGRGRTVLLFAAWAEVENLVSFHASLAVFFTQFRGELKPADCGVGSSMQVLIALWGTS
jgi:hypothetical protein